MKQNHKEYKFEVRCAVGLPSAICQLAFLSLTPFTSSSLITLLFYRHYSFPLHSPPLPHTHAFFFIFLVKPHDVQDLSSPTRNWTCAPLQWKSLISGLQESPWSLFFLISLLQSQGLHFRLCINLSSSYVEMKMIMVCGLLTFEWLTPEDWKITKIQKVLEFQVSWRERVRTIWKDLMTVESFQHCSYRTILTRPVSWRPTHPWHVPHLCHLFPYLYLLSLCIYQSLSTW